jgi:hypothetical protein
MRAERHDWCGSWAKWRTLLAAERLNGFCGDWVTQYSAVLGRLFVITMQYPDCLGWRFSVLVSTRDDQKPKRTACHLCFGRAWPPLNCSRSG